MCTARFCRHSKQAGSSGARSICLSRKALTKVPVCHLKVTAVKGKFKVPEHWQEHVKNMAGGKQRALHRQGNALHAAKCLVAWRQITAR